MKGEEQSAVTAQLAGTRAGASPEAYAAVFADIAARRKDLEGKRKALSISPRRPKAGKTDDGSVMAGLLRSALAVLSDPAVPGAEKRGVLSPIVERVICRKGGADVVFAPGLFGDSWGKDNMWSKDGIGEDGSPSGGESARSTYQTTCMVCQVRADQCHLVISEAT